MDEKEKKQLSVLTWRNITVDEQKFSYIHTAVKILILAVLNLDLEKWLNLINPIWKRKNGFQS